MAIRFNLFSKSNAQKQQYQVIKAQPVEKIGCMKNPLSIKFIQQSILTDTLKVKGSHSSKAYKILQEI